jgi:hypothetical protein
MTLRPLRQRSQPVAQMSTPDQNRRTENAPAESQRPGAICTPRRTTSVLAQEIRRKIRRPEVSYVVLANSPAYTKYE